MNIVSRAEWGARLPDGRVSAPGPFSELWLHHTAGREQDGPGGVRAVQNFHMDSRGFDDIAYTFVVDRNATVYEGRGPGVVGAHTAGRNSVSAAICVLGNYDVDVPSDRVLRAVADLVRHGHRLGWWTVSTLTGGHRQVGRTSCPGHNLYARIGDINRYATVKESPVARRQYAQAVVGVSDVDLEHGRVLAQAYDAALVRHTPSGFESITHGGPCEVLFGWLVGQAANRKIVSTALFSDGTVAVSGEDRDATAQAVADTLLAHPPGTIARRGRPW